MSMCAQEFVDLHQHVLYGMDDGPKTAEEMQAMLEMDAKEGISLIFATSHSSNRLQRDGGELYRKHLEEANAYCREKQLPVKVVEGCEIFYTDTTSDMLAQGKLMTLASSRYALLEFNVDCDIGEIASAASLYNFGFIPVIAHVERYRCLVRNAARAMDMKDRCGLSFQMNADSVVSPYGFFRRRFVEKMLKAHAIDVIATDAHSVSTRPPRMKEAFAKIARDHGEEYAQSLVSFGKMIVASSI